MTERKEEGGRGRLQVGDAVVGLAGEYRVESVRGEGGFGIAYAGVRTSDGAEIILKELRIERLKDWKALDLFEREAAALKSLAHPRIPAFHDFFAWDGQEARPPASIEQGDGPPPSLVLVQQRIAGVTLAQHIAEKRRFSSEDVERLLRAMLAILRYLHELHPPVIHRDIHPHNVILGEDGAPYLVDFGAIQDRLRFASIGSTQVGASGYVPPEQAMGAARPASDLYALGMTMLAIVGHRDPHEMPLDERTAKVRVRELAPSLPPRLAAALDRMVEPTVGERVGSAAEALRLLDAPAASGGGPRAIAVAAAATCVLAAGLAGFLALRGKKEGPIGLPMPVSALPLPSRPTAGYWGRAFVADANADGMPDVIGHDFQGNLFAVDGRTGAPLWNAHTQAEWFSGEGSLILGWKGKDFLVHAFDARSGASLWSSRLSDAYKSARFAEGCVVVRTGDGKEVGLDAKRGEPKPCNARSEEESKWEVGGMAIRIGGMELFMTEEGPGTPRLSIRRQKGDKQVWKSTLDVLGERLNFGTNVAYTALGLLVAGKHRANPNDGFTLFLLDPATGEIRKKTDVSTVRSIHALHVMAKGRLLAVENSGLVYAFDPETLARTWTSGSG